MRRAFDTETLRSITHSLGRFLAIAAIVALGTGFYAGLRMTAPDMKLAADEFFDGTALMDIRVLSTLGMTDDDVAALRRVEGVEAVMPAYETDVMVAMANEEYATRVHSLPDTACGSVTSDGVRAISDDSDYLNRPILVKGSWPQRSGECVLSANLVVDAETSVGDTLTIVESAQDMDDALVTRTYTIVGYVNAPYYATSSGMGSTTLGTGTIQQFMYVPEDDFSVDMPYTEVYISVCGAAEKHASSTEYDNLVAAVAERISAVAPGRALVRTNEVRDEAQQELDDKRAEYDGQKADTELQLGEAKQQLDEAAATIDQSERELADGQASYDDGAAQLVSQRSNAIAQMAAAEQQIVDGQAQVDAARPQMEAIAAQLADGRAQWQQGADALTAGWAQWQQQSDQLEEGIVQAQQVVDELEGGIAQAQVLVDQMQAGIDDLQLQIDALDPSDPDYVAKRTALEASQQDLNAQKQAADDQIQQLQALLPTAQVTLDDLLAQRPGLEAAHDQLAAEQQTLDDSKASLDESQAAYDEQRDAFDASVAELAQGRGNLAYARSQMDAQIAFAQQQLDQVAGQLERGRSQLEQGRVDYEQGLAEYETKRTDADVQLADAAMQLDDAQHQIDELADAEWLIMDRTTNYGASSFEADADRVDNIAAVFPFIFFLVAALVALTTMTRMVEEERVLIGTFKALGYHRARIASKYLAYAAIASGAGSIVGIAVLSQVLPVVIMNAYSIIYFVPAMAMPLPIDPGIAGLAAGLGVGVTLFATWAAATATLRERPATLMLPRAPKAGRRILLERAAPIWRRISFSWKVTFRNLFRYKKRLVMTVIGIAGCTALLLTGLGLSDAINDILDKQFGDIMKYNAVITLDDDATDEQAAHVSEILDDDQLVDQYLLALRENMLTSKSDGTDLRVEVVVPDNPSAFGNLFTLRERVGHQAVDLTENGLVLSEKLARELGVDVGDVITLTEQDDIGNATSVSYEAEVTGIVENYIYHYVFVGPALYERLVGEAPIYDSALAITTTDPGLRTQLSEELHASGGVKTIAFNDETIDTYHDMLSSVNMIVVVLVVAAAALAFIVLYNLTNINITERMREIATLKVLGFTPLEMNAYIFRETFLLAAIGCAVGLVLGVWMESFVVVTAEVDQVMFGREIHVASFGIAFLLTMLFSFVVMLAMRGKLVRIDMVESLKSNE